MPTVRDASFDLFRAHGMTTMFGNPGSTELPMLADFPDDFRYVLGLQEAVVVGMADGYAQASGRTTLVNLHTAPGVGNAMGAIFNAQANHSPLLITAGQQVRAQITLQANLTNRDATRMPHPLVKWSYEPPRAEDVPLALARGAHLASLPPRGPVFVSMPMDDWYAEVDEAAAREPRSSGRVNGRARPTRRRSARSPSASTRRATRCWSPAPTSTRAGGWDAAVALAERQRLPVWATPAPGGGRLGFPESHPNFRGVLPPAIGPVAQTLEGHDLILVAGSSVFPYYPYIPGPLLPEGAVLVAITSDPDEAARAPMGDAIVADVKLTLEALLEAVPESAPPVPGAQPGPAGDPGRADPLNPSTVHSALAEVFPEDGIVVLESPSQHPRAAQPAAPLAAGQLLLQRPAAGSASASPPRSACSSPSPTARSSACSARARPSTRSPPSGAPSPTRRRSPSSSCATPSTRSSSGSPRSRRSQGAPGLDLPALDVAAVAEGYGVNAHRAERARRGARRAGHGACLLEAGAGRSPGRARDVAVLKRRDATVAPAMVVEQRLCA